MNVTSIGWEDAASNWRAEKTSGNIGGCCGDDKYYDLDSIMMITIMMEMVEKAILQTAAAATRLISPLEHITQLHTWIPPGFHFKQY